MRLGCRRTALATTLVATCGLVGACGGTSFSSSAFDAGVDANAPDASLETFCTRADGGAGHTFCDDFDGPALATKWDTISLSKNTGSVEVDDTQFVTAPNSLATTAQTTQLATANVGRVQKGFGAVSTISVTFDVRLTSLPDKPLASATGGDSFLAIGFGSDYTIGLDASSATVGYYEDLTGGDAGTVSISSRVLVQPSSLVKGTWEHVTFAIDLGKKTLTASLAGQSFTQSISPPPDVSSATNATLFVGAFSRNMQGSDLEVSYDDVVVDTTP